MVLKTDLALNTGKSEGTISSYKNKILYNDIFSGVEENKFFEFIGDNFYYGRIDQFSNPIFPIETNLVQVFYKNNLVKLPQITAKALTDMQYYFAIANTAISKNSNYIDIFASRGYVPFYQQYLNYLSSFYKVFFQKITYDKNKYIKDPNTFMDVFLEICTHYIKKFNAPVTRTGFILSEYFSFNSTGLVVDLYDIDKNDDQEKYDDFIKDLNFDFFVETANRFNFFVDKNIPTRLIFNIFSNDDLYSEIPIDVCGGFKTSGYFYRFDIKSVDDFFEKNYTNSMSGQGGGLQDSELDSLKIIFTEFYNTFISPNIEFAFASENMQKKIELKKNIRSLLNVNQLSNYFTEEYWLKILLYLRALETKQHWNQTEYDYYFKKTIVIYKNYNLSAAIKFINFITKNILEVDKKNTLMLEREDIVNKLNPEPNNFKF